LNLTSAAGHQRKRAASMANVRAGRYAATGPECWGWRRPEAAEIAAERLAELEQRLTEAQG
jgi:hypothetical protein